MVLHILLLKHMQNLNKKKRRTLKHTILYIRDAGK